METRGDPVHAGQFPDYAWQQCLSLPHPRGIAALPSVAEAWLAFALWPGVAVAVAVTVLRRRDM
ncbi:hypothetical protein [Streptomyces sp. RFCAC02]|uniref:hypothetical protein n=1 Tax=Streptomyces sp. RFCAC02 TaxID=2499143 RepID=UPI001020A157|nr:hypothetical protein [Streptomyces sp. RFCAC02]